MILIVVVPPVFVFIKDYVSYILLTVAIFLILKDDVPFSAAIVFGLSGLIGYFALNSLNQPLLILLTGFFGFPILFKMERKIVKQIKSYEYKISKLSALRGSFSAFVSSLMLTFIPAAGDFVNAQLLGGPQQQMIGNVIQSRFLRVLDYPGAAAMSFVLMATILLAVAIYARLFGTEELMS